MICDKKLRYATGWAIAIWCIIVIAIIGGIIACICCARAGRQQQGSVYRGGGPNAVPVQTQQCQMQTYQQPQVQVVTPAPTTTPQRFTTTTSVPQGQPVYEV